MTNLMILSNLYHLSAQKILRAFKARDFSNNVVLRQLPTLINPLETKARPAIDHCLRCISGFGEVGVVVVRGFADLCNAAAA